MKIAALGCLIALPLFAQTTTTTTTTITETTMKSHKVKKGAVHTRVANDSTRLAAILNDVQNEKTTFSEATWRSTVNEANALANRIYAGTGGRAVARDLRMHVREMRKAALNGDAAGARQHASEALPFAYQVIDWANS